MIIFEDLTESIMQGNESKLIGIVQRALKSQIPVQEILDGLIESMNIIGTKFKNGELFIPELLMAAKTMKAGIEVIRPLFDKSGVKLSGRVVIGTVRGDLHDIGKNLVRMLMEAAGYQVTDLGVDVPIEKFVDAVKSNRPNIVGLSALLTTTMPTMKLVIESLIEAGVRNNVKVMVGGAPVTEKFAKEIGADGYGSSAAAAVEVAKKLIAD